MKGRSVSWARTVHETLGRPLVPLTLTDAEHDELERWTRRQKTAQALALKKGRAGTMTHDYKRHGTTTLFAVTAAALGSRLNRDE